MGLRTFVCWMALLSSIVSAGAQALVEPTAGLAKRTFPSFRAFEAPTIDGVPDEALWRSSPIGDSFTDRLSGVLAPDQTRFAVAYDAKFIYVAIWAYDAQPDQIQARETTEDSRFTTSSNSDLFEDHVDFRLDPYQTASSQQTSIFSVNAIGTKSAFIAGGRAKKKEWKGDWKAMVARNSGGWTAEMSIPWEILNYPSGKNSHVFGFNVFRFVYRTRTQSCWSDVGPNFYNDRQGLWTGVEPPPPPKPKISFLPYGIVGTDEDQVRSRFGIDARYPINQELTAVMTANPDFGTIEGAVESIAFSRSERFVPERRPFFLEGSSYFELGQPYDLARFFYPRRIADFDVGAKVYGKATPIDSIGVLATSKFGERDDVAAKWTHQFTQTRVVDVFYGGSWGEKDSNSAFAIRTQERFGKLTPDVYLAETSGNGMNGGASQIALAYDDAPNFAYLRWRTIDPDFRVANGLTGFTGYRGFGFYDTVYREFRSGKVRDYMLELDLSYDWKTGGETFRKFASIGGAFTNDRDVRMGIWKNWGEFEGASDDYWSLFLRFGATNRFRQYGLVYEFGTIADVDYSYFGPSFSFRVSKGFDIAYSGSVLNLDGRERQEILTVAYEISPVKSIGGRVVRRNGKTNGYVSYRNSGKKGMETFFIIGDPNAEKFKRIVQLKIVFPF